MASGNMNTGLILVIDDELDAIEFVQFAFSKRGFDVIGSPQPGDGLRLARERQPDIVLVDVMLPQMNGFDLCRQLRADAQTAHLPLIVLSARNSSADRAEAKAAGADRYLSKPVSIKALAGAIEELLQEKNAHSGHDQPDMPER
jgi:DNA-binding response OmpR family regulator